MARSLQFSAGPSDSDAVPRLSAPPLRHPARRFEMLRLRACPLLVVFALSVPSHAATRSVDTSRSSLTIHVGKSGVFSAFGDNHTIRAPITSGKVDEPPAPRVEVTVEAKKLTVLDPELSAAKRDE